jgi:hypothetical protein
MAVVFGPRLISFLVLAIGNTLKWAAANALVIAGYIALALAIAAVVLLIEDIIVWMRGGKSVMGDMLGPFDKFVESFKKLFTESDFFASFRMLEKLFKGDFGGAWEELKTSIRDVSGLLGDMLLLVIAITAGWMIWRVMRFFGLVQAMTGLINVVTKVGAAAIATTGSLEAMNLVSFVGLLTKLGLVAGALTFLLGVGSAGGEDPAFSKEKNEEYLRGRKPEDKDTGISGFMRRYLPTWMTGVGLEPKATEFATPPGLVPQVTPGQVTGTPAPAGTAAPGATGDQTNTVNQTNNVTINALNADDIPASLTRTFDAAAQNALDALARQARNASPRTEAPAQ